MDNVSFSCTSGACDKTIKPCVLLQKPSEILGMFINAQFSTFPAADSTFVLILVTAAALQMKRPCIAKEN